MTITENTDVKGGTLTKSTCDALTSRLDLYGKIASALRDVQEGRMSPLPEVMDRVLTGIPK